MISGYTKKMIIESFNELLLNKPFEKITIEDIIKNCNISRSTFYRHFKDKYELIEYDYCQKVNDVVYNGNFDRSWKDIQLELVYFNWQHKSYHKRLAAHDVQNGFNSIAYEQGVQFYIDRIKHNLNLTFLPENLLIYIKVYNKFGVTTYNDWYQEKYIMTPEEFSSMLYDFMPDILKEALR